MYRQCVNISNSFSWISWCNYKERVLPLVSVKLRRFSGKVIQQESDLYIKKNGRVEDGGVVATSAGTLPCKHVLHAVVQGS